MSDIRTITLRGGPADGEQHRWHGGHLFRVQERVGRVPTGVSRMSDARLTVKEHIYAELDDEPNVFEHQP